MMEGKERKKARKDWKNSGKLMATKRVNKENKR